MKIELDQDKCIGSGQCVMAAMDVFDQRDDDGIAVLITDTPVADDVDAVREAAAICPAAAITVNDS